jgi:hypothetical protein
LTISTTGANGGFFFDLDSFLVGATTDSAAGRFELDTFLDKNRRSGGTLLCLAISTGVGAAVLLCDLYTFLEPIRPIVPKANVVTKSKIHAAVMIPPTGKMPRVLPGIVNAAALCAAKAIEVGIAAAAALAPWPSNTPVAKKAMDALVMFVDTTESVLTDWA